MKGISALLICIHLLGTSAQTELVTEDTATVNICEDPNTIVANDDNFTVVANGQNVKLTCQFNLPMNCKWIKRKGEQHIPVLLVGARYNFCLHNGIHQMDCSLIIKSYEPSKDAEVWHCLDTRQSPVKIFKTYTLANDSASTEADSTAQDEDIFETTPFDDNSGSPPPITDTNPSEAITVVTETSLTTIHTIEIENTGTTQIEEPVTEEPHEPHVDVKIVNPPRNATLSIGQELTLTCVFNAKVNCAWKKNGTELIVSGQNRYLYTDDQKGINTADCTLEQGRVEEEGLTEWECSSLTNEKIFSKAWIKIIPVQDNSEMKDSSPSTLKTSPESYDETPTEKNSFPKNNSSPSTLKTSPESYEETPTEKNSSPKNMKDSSPSTLKTNPESYKENTTEKNSSPKYNTIKAVSTGEVETSSSTVTVVVSIVVTCVVGLTIAISMCLYKRRKHTYKPNEADSVLVVHDVRPVSVKPSEQLEKKPAQSISSHHNGQHKDQLQESQPKGKLTESDSSDV